MHLLEVFRCRGDKLMNSIDNRTILIEILRVGLISIRNRCEYPERESQNDEKLKQWANLCHSIPAVLLGNCDDRAVQYFIKGDLCLFCSNYSTPNDADFRQILALREELDAIRVFTKADALRIAKDECIRRNWSWNEHTTVRWGIFNFTVWGGCRKGGNLFMKIRKKDGAILHSSMTPR
jgi:hypothetical protein